MIKKIIVLAISFVLTLGSVVYTETTNATPVKYGTGTGVSRTITNAKELAELMQSLPNASIYDEYADVTQAEGYENFKGITIFENGVYNKYSNYVNNIRLDDNPDLPEEEIEYFYSRVHEHQNKRLEMYFDKNCVYYHSVGTTWTTVEYYKTNVEGFLSGNAYDLEIAKGYATDFDIEAYYSKDRVLMKINKNETYYQEALPVESPKSYLSYKRVEEPTSEDDDEDDEPSDDEIYQDIALRALNDNLGVWVELDRSATGVDGMEPDYEAIQNMTKEQEEEYMMNFMIQALLSELSYAQINSLTNANLLNYTYLTKLSSFITESIEKPGYYEVNGPKYELKFSVPIPDGYRCNSCGVKFDQEKDSCPCGSTDIIESTKSSQEPTYSYLRALMGWPAYDGNNNGYSYSGGLKFTVGPNTSIEQKFARNYSSQNYLSLKFEETTLSNSTILNVDNTAVQALKNAKVKSLDDSFGKSFRKIFNEYKAQLEAQQGGNN